MGKTLRLLVSVAIPLAVGFLGSLFTTPSIGNWYAELAKPALTPPNWIFGPVWTTLFVLMGISLFLVWNKREHGWRFLWFGKKAAAAKRRTRFIVLFIVQLALNLLWSVIFFGAHLPGLASFEILLLAATIAILIALAWKISKPAAWLLVPYLAWVGFATYLTWALWLLN